MEGGGLNIKIQEYENKDKNNFSIYNFIISNIVCDYK